MYKKFLNSWQLLHCQFRPSQFRLSIAILIVIVAGTTEAASINAEALSLVKGLEQQNPEYLSDMHGNADNGLQRLMVLRFQATSVVQAAIDRMQGNPKQRELVAALYRVLGFVKDPASVPWLEIKLRGSERQTIHDRYMQQWHDGIGIGFGNNQGFGGWQWLTGRDQWIAFFVDAYASERNSDRRVELINILKGFDDPLAMHFFVARRTMVSAPKQFDPRETLLSEAYLYQHDVPVDEKRIVSAVKALAGDSRNRELLIGTADALRHEAFVPYLISTLDVAEEGVFPAYFPSRRILENITFELDITSNKDWNLWYSKHLGESRKQWLQSAIESFKARLARDPTGARQWFARKASYSWNEIAVLALIRTELLPRAEFHSEIAGWINMTYSEFYRARLKPVADELLRHPEQLEDWARRLLAGRRLDPSSPPITWEVYVRRSNQRM